MQVPKHTVVQKKNDPYVYLWVMGEWYCYNVTEPPIGSGAMGDVFLGYRCKDGAEVAVKKVKDVYANNPMIRARARQEASLAYRHPNLVEMIGYCEASPAAGPIFLISNVVHGEDVDKYVKRLPDGADRESKITRNIIIPVLDALVYIHSRGVIHRDIKPSNIMVEQDSNVRLMDLGISRMNGGNKFSQYGFIGTPQYSAPEQIKRDEGDASGRINATTDIYELGITFYELLTGENPMDAESDTETLTRQLSVKLPSNPLISRRMMRVIWKATEKKQSDRYQTAAEFKNAVVEALQPAPSLWERMSSWMQDHLLTIVTVVVGLAVLFFIIILITA